MAEAFLQVDVDHHDVDVVLGRARSIFRPMLLQEFLRVGPSRTLRDRAVRRFEMEGDDASGKWAPLRFSTEEIRKAKGYAPEPINRRDDEMFDFVTGNPGSTHADGKGATLEWPSPIPGAGSELFDKLNTAQLGRTSPSTVARPVIAIDEKDAEEMLAELMEWFATEMARVSHV